MCNILQNIQTPNILIQFFFFEKVYIKDIRKKIQIIYLVINTLLYF